MKFYNKAVLPQGFQANGVACGVKKSGKLDLALIYSGLPALAAIMSTTNDIPAAPIIVNAAHLKRAKKFHAIIANSGNANAFCGKAGVTAAQRMAEAAAGALSIQKESVLVASTGIIGKQLPVEKVETAAHELAAGLAKNGITKAAKAIMTTDKFLKAATVKFNIAAKPITVCAVAKGAGMISPDMATMLVFILTDAVISPGVLSAALRTAVKNTFNSITVDGCMSTNDTVICLANQAAANRQVKSGKGLGLFLAALEMVCLDLAKKIVRDGEGASKLIHIRVCGAKQSAQARKIALSIANSNLFKTAMFASSPNVRGRIVAAAGAGQTGIKENELKISFSPLHKKAVEIKVSVGRGKACAEVYTSDLTHKYIKINAEYN
ncbi:MAG: bifunctional glutamate N-acetyltransferase/amino-acid acetyltransferase ArgJ [Candidatus Omnitrophota bacterium]